MLVAALARPTARNKELLELFKVVVGAAGPILAALIVGIAGTYIAHYYTNERERQTRQAADNRHKQDLEAANLRHELDVAALKERHQLDKESEWRKHSVELTKLDFERKLKNWDPSQGSLRPVILDFLAVYRDLKELDFTSPSDLYKRISQKRITKISTRSSQPEIDGIAAGTSSKDSAQDDVDLDHPDKPPGSTVSS